MAWKNIFGFLLFLAILAGILILGPYISKLSDRNYRKTIDKRGKLTRAYIIERKSYKGRFVYFAYFYNSGFYRNNQEGDSLYNNLSVGDSVTIKLDSLHPGDSYIITK